MRKKFVLFVFALAISALALTVAAARGPSPDSAGAASHREAPLIANDPAADLTDVFFFRSYEAGQAEKVVLVMDVIPGEEPSAGPNYYNFDPSVGYSFGIDNNGDGRANDVTIDFDFKQEIRGAVSALGLPLAYVGNLPPPERGAGAGSIIPPITALDGPGSEGLGIRQSYEINVTRKGPTGSGSVRRQSFSNDVTGKPLFAVPSNVGPRTMPNYLGLVAQGTYDLGNGVRVFTGQRQDPFYIDLGAVFDSLNLRRFPPLLTALEDVNDNANAFGVDMLSGFNVHTIAIEMPASMLTVDGGTTATSTQPFLGMYAFTNRSRATVRGTGRDIERSVGNDVQIARLANPLVNELIIGTADKDRWNATKPENEGEFLMYHLKPRLAAALELATGFPTGCIPEAVVPAPDCAPRPVAPVSLAPPLSNFNRTDLVNLLLKYGPADPGFADLLRLNLRVAATPLASQRRLGVIGGDLAGFPNGRRPRDDVTDIAIRAVGGPLYITNRAGDGINVDDAPLLGGFPFLATPADGRNRDDTPHLDPQDVGS